MVINCCPQCGNMAFWADIRKTADALGLVVVSYSCGNCGHRIEVEPDAEAARRVLAPRGMGDPRIVRPL